MLHRYTIDSVSLQAVPAKQNSAQGAFGGVLTFALMHNTSMDNQLRIDVCYIDVSSIYYWHIRYQYTINNIYFEGGIAKQEECIGRFMVYWRLSLTLNTSTMYQQTIDGISVNDVSTTIDVCDINTQSIARQYTIDSEYVDISSIVSVNGTSNQLSIVRQFASCQWNII